MLSQNNYTIEILDLSLEVIEYMMGGNAEYYRASEIARQLKMNRSRVFRILKTLEKRGYVEFDPQTQGYCLGLKFLTIGENVRERLDLRREAQDVLLELARHTGDVAHLLVLFGQSAVCIDRYQGENMLQVAAPIGVPLPLYIGASPKILLAHLPLEERERIIEELDLRPFTPYTITDKEKLRRCLEQIRNQGYAVDEQDYEIGVYAIGAPVRDHTARVVAGITVTVPEVRYDESRKEKLIQMVVEAAKKVSSRLGYIENYSLNKKDPLLTNPNKTHS